MTNATDGTDDPQIPPLRYQDQNPLVKGNVQKRHLENRSIRKKLKMSLNGILSIFTSSLQ